MQYSSPQVPAWYFRSPRTIRKAATPKSRSTSKLALDARRGPQHAHPAGVAEQFQAFLSTPQGSQFQAFISTPQGSQWWQDNARIQRSPHQFQTAPRTASQSSNSLNTVEQKTCQDLVGYHYAVGKELGSGSFGRVYAGQDAVTSEEVAIKLEICKVNDAQLSWENKLYNHLAGVQGIPRSRYFNQIWLDGQRRASAMVLDLLGPDLESVREKRPNGRFPLKQIRWIAVQAIHRLEDVHNKGIIHRDVKPDNFMIGLGSKKHVLHLIDFGLSKFWWDFNRGRHIPWRNGKNLTGTARYASIRTHSGEEQSRRDDLESLGYNLIYLAKGRLPWQGMKAETDQEKYDKIAQKKRETSIEDLCRGLDPAFALYLKYCRGLQFEGTPDYGYMRGLFQPPVASTATSQSSASGSSASASSSSSARPAFGGFRDISNGAPPTLAYWGLKKRDPLSKS